MTFQSLLLVPNNSVIIHDTLYKVHIVYYTMHFHTTLCNFPNYLTISIVWRFPVKWDWSIYGAADPSAKCVPCTVYTSCEFIIWVYNTVAEPFFSSFHSSHLLPCMYRDRGRIFQIVKSMYKSMCAIFWSNPVQGLGSTTVQS